MGVHLLTKRSPSTLTAEPWATPNRFRLDAWEGLVRRIGMVASVLTAVSLCTWTGVAGSQETTTTTTVDPVETTTTTTTADPVETTVAPETTTTLVEETTTTTSTVPSTTTTTRPAP